MANRQFVGDLQPVQPRIPYLVRHKPVPGPGAYDLHSEIGERRSSSPRKNEVYLFFYFLHFIACLYYR